MSDTESKHWQQCYLTSVVELDAMIRLLSDFVHDVECYCSEKPTMVCPVHEAEELLKLNDRSK